MTEPAPREDGQTRPAAELPAEAGARTEAASSAAAEPIAGAEPLQVGVGPWEGPWPEGEHWDPELLRHGDRRNVVDEFRYWRLESIVAALDERRHDFHVAIENWGHDFNIGSVVRTANAFLAREIHIVGRRRWNRRGAMVTDRYQHLRHHPTSEDFLAWAQEEQLPVIAVDNVPGSEPLELFDLPRRCVLLFGQEGPGVSPEVLEAAAATVAIEQFGSTRSINAGAAAAVTMHAWIRRHVHGQIPVG